MHISLVAFNARFTHTCPGLFHVRNELEIHCPEARLDFFQFTINDSYYETLLRITASRPDFVFFSTAIWNSDLVERLIRDVKVCLPACLAVVGGPQAASVGSSLGEALCSMVIGAIEAVGPGFYRDLRACRLKFRYKAAFKQMPAFVSPYRDADFPRYLQNRHIYYESSRGCPFSCTYCLSAAEQGIFRKDLSQVEAELDRILSHGPSVLRFVDRTFNEQPERALAIWRYLVGRAKDTLCHFEISPDHFTDEMLVFLKGVPPGLFQFEIGIQSTNPETLRAVRRPLDPEKTGTVVRALASLGNIHLHVDLILGLPYETRQTFLASFAQVFSMNVHYIQMGLLKILPDTPLCHTAEEHSYLSCLRPPYSVVANRWINHESMGRLYWFCECVERFMNNRYFVSIWRHFRRSGEDIVSFFEGLLAVCRRQGFFGLAATQELMTRMVLQATAGRDDAGVLADLLRFDWLRCGHRFLPECLGPPGDGEDPVALKKRMFLTLPEQLEGVYAAGEKGRFCKRGLFATFTEKGMLALGYTGAGACLCFLPDREAGLHGFARVVRLPDGMASPESCQE
ncbi:MAG: DUF4080 domain-containing protein [Desulfocapsaceae bacterium]|nr:DUF4080 domain-containing protein [Desulfocapsaceae bacterium]